MRLPALLLLASLSPTAAKACGVELVLAMDVSRSVINAEYDLQMGGLANAFRNPEVIEAISWIPGGVMASVTEWSGASSQAQTVGWRELSTAGSVKAFAAEIETTRRQFFGRFTAVGEALFHANTLSSSNPRTCTRRVIDISGDGKSNRGREPKPISVALAANGVTINALVIKGAKPDPEEYYLQHVINGPGAFIEVANGFEDYTRAMTQKLLRELSPSIAAR